MLFSKKENHTNRCFFIIPAGGQGLRFGTNIPKQFLSLAGKPVLVHTLEKIVPFALEIILVLPKDYHDYWEGIYKEHPILTPIKIVEGGKTRFQSVQNALKTLPKEGLVAIHDGVRPFVSEQLISHLMIAAEKNGAAIPYLPITDSIRTNDIENSKSIDRSSFVRIQTPQFFDLALLKEAYSKEELSFFTDDASVYEHHTHKAPYLVLGEENNIKLTTSLDWNIAQSILSQNTKGI